MEYYTVLYYFLKHSIEYYTVLYYTVLYYTVLYYFLYCTVLFYSRNTVPGAGRETCGEGWKKKKEKKTVPGEVGRLRGRLEAQTNAAVVVNKKNKKNTVPGEGGETAGKAGSAD